MDVEVFKPKHEPPKKESRMGSFTATQKTAWQENYMRENKLSDGNFAFLLAMVFFLLAVLCAGIRKECSDIAYRDSPKQCTELWAYVSIALTIGFAICFVGCCVWLGKRAIGPDRLTRAFNDARDAEEVILEQEHQVAMRDHRRLVVEEFKQFCAKQQLSPMITAVAESDKLCLKYTRADNDGVRHVFRMTV